MEEQQRNIDEVFRQMLSDYREAPPGAVWHDIASRLDEEEDRRRTVFWRWPWVALCLLLAVGCGWAVVSINRGRGNAGQDAALTSQNTPVVGQGAALASDKAAVAGNNELKETEMSQPGSDKQSASDKDVPSKGAAAKALALHSVKEENSASATSPVSMARQQQDNNAPGEEGVNNAPEKAQPIASEQIAARQPQQAMPMLGQERIKQAAIPGSKTPEMLFASQAPVAALPVIKKEQQTLSTDDLVPASGAKGVLDNTAKQAEEAEVKAGAEPSAANMSGAAITSSDSMAGPKIYPFPGLAFSIAAMIGYEYGFGAEVMNRYNASLRMLWHISQTVAIGIQPAFRLGQLSTTILRQPQHYYTSTIQVDSFTTIDQSPSVRGQQDIIYNYVIREKRDSIVVKGRTAGGRFWEAEMPVVLQMQVSKSFSVFGGPSLNIGGKLSYNDGGAAQTYTSVRKDSLSQSQPISASSFNNYFGKPSGEPYSAYQQSTAAQDPAAVRAGYVIGVGYNCGNISAMASMHQQLSGYQDMEQPLQKVYSTPSVRLSVGYRIFSTKPKGRAVAE